MDRAWNLKLSYILRASFDLIQVQLSSADACWWLVLGVGFLDQNYERMIMVYEICDAYSPFDYLS